MNIVKPGQLPRTRTTPAHTAAIPLENLLYVGNCSRCGAVVEEAYKNY